MPLLTIVASNRDRFDLNSNITKFFIKSLEWQTNLDFTFLISDGGSKNYNEIKEYFETRNGKIKMKVVQYKIGEAFERARLNNVGIRNADTKYVACTDVDMMFDKNFIQTVIDNLKENVFIESRTLYMKDYAVNKIYSGEIDPCQNIEACKVGRLKNVTTAGGWECTSIDNWNVLKGFNEEMVGWGSEDFELLTRVGMRRIKTIWLSQTRETAMVFHQPHPKPNIKFDLECQEQNKKILQKTKIDVNAKGWGGIYD